MNEPPPMPPSGRPRPGTDKPAPALRNLGDGCPVLHCWSPSVLQTPDGTAPNGRTYAASGTKWPRTPDAEETRAAAEDTLHPDSGKSPIIAAPAADKAP